MTPTRELLALRFGSLWRFFWAQGFAYWAMCLYLVLEYARPQQLIGALSALPIGQIVLGSALLGHLVSGRWFAMKGIGSWLLLLFTAVIVLSSLTADNPGVAIGQWRLWFSWIAIYFLIINVVNSEQQLVGFTLFWLLINFYLSQGAAKQFALRGFTFTEWGVIGAPGWFNNSGEFGIGMCMFLVVAWHYYLAARPYLTRWRKLVVLLMPVTAILGIVGSSSRGAVLGLGAVGIWLLLRTKHRLRSALGIAVLAAVVWFIVPEQQKARFRSAGEDYTSQTRETYWRNGLDMARDHPVLGVGYGNWITYYTAHYVDPRTPWYDPAGRVQLAHNIFIQAVAELGYVGLGGFLLLILTTLWINYRTRRLARAGRTPPNSFMIQLAYGLDGAMISYLVCGFFVSVFYYPFFWINLAFTVALGGVARQESRKLLAVSAGGKKQGHVR